MLLTCYSVVIRLLFCFGGADNTLFMWETSFFKMGNDGEQDGN